MKEEMPKHLQSIRKQISIMKEDVAIKALKEIVGSKILTPKEANLILDSVMRIEFRFDEPIEGELKF